MSNTHKGKWHHPLEAFGFDLLMGGLGALSLDAASQAGSRLVRLLGPRLSAHRTALRNLQLAFPDWHPARRQSVARAMWAQIGAVIGEFPHLHELDPYGQDGRVRVLGTERLDALRVSGQGAVFFSGHFANWEIMAAALVQRGLICHVGHRPPNNPLIAARIGAVRRGYGVTLQAAKGRLGGLQLARALARGESIALLSDQKYNEGVSAPLFGHAAMTADVAPRLALRFGVPLIPLHVVRLTGARFEVHVHEGLTLRRDAPLEEAVLDGVNQINAFIEACARAEPEQWFWVHRRWPKAAWASLGSE